MENSEPSKAGNVSTQNEAVTKRLHVIPVGDADIHAAQATCWCYPIEMSPNLFVHNAKDCREAKERIVRDWPLEDQGIGYSTDAVKGWVNIAEHFEGGDGT